jgi:hypothetical protein
MRKTLALFLFLAAACAGGTSTGADTSAAPADPTMPADPNDIIVGNWSVVYEAEGSPRTFTMMIQSAAAGQYTATTTGDTPMGFRIRRISKNGNGMIIDASTDRNLISIRVSGNGQLMRGTFSVDQRPMGVVFTRVP